MRRKNTSIIIGILCLAFTFFAEQSSANENLRIKVENLSVSNKLSNKYIIYCVPSLEEAYLQNEFDLFWKNKVQIDQFITILSEVSNDGLIADDYHYSELLALRKSQGKSSEIDFEIMLSDAFLLYSSHLINGKLNPKNIDPEWHVIKTEINPVPFLFEIKSVSLESIIEQISPLNENYHLFKKELKRLKSMTKFPSPNRIEKGVILKEGMIDDRIISVRRQLHYLNYLEQNDQSNSYDKPLLAAIIQFQEDNGLEAKGVIGNLTIDALNVTVADKIEIVKANMERMRWLPRKMPEYYLYVNIADYSLELVRNDKIVKKHKVIVGKTARKTPVFSAKLNYLVINPTWTVPPTILKNDVIPESRRSIDYLAGKNIGIYDSKGDKIDPSIIDWNGKAVYGYTFRQAAGPSNALGAVKFIFPNKYDVYLHDTPSKELFDRSERAFSSGCVRVQDPLSLAEVLLNDQKQYSLSKIQELVKIGVTKTIILQEKPDVFLIYQTAWGMTDGKIAYRKDIYERDKALINALKETAVYDVIEN